MAGIDARLGRTINDLEEIAFNSFEGIAPALTRNILALLDRLDVSGGRLTPGQSLRLLSRLEEIFRQQFRKADYNRGVARFLSRIDEVREANVRFHERENRIQIAESLLSQAEEQMVNLTRSYLEQGWVDRRLILPMRRIISRAVGKGIELNELKREIESRLTGDPTLTHNQLASYAQLVARDTVGQYNGLIQQKVATAHSLDAFRYSGTLVESSRSQCRKWLNTEVIRITELNDEIAWAKRNGSGMVDATTADNFAIYRGGYNCRHQVYATRS